MARHSISNSSGNISNPWIILVFIIIAVFWFLVALALTFTLYAPPFILIGGLLSEIGDHRRQTSLTSEEADELAKLESNLCSVRSRLAQINEEGSHLKRNVDGSYHRGSKLGMLLNDETEELTPIEEELSEQSATIRLKPLNALHKWVQAESLRPRFGGLLQHIS